MADGIRVGDASQKRLEKEIAGIQFLDETEEVVTDDGFYGVNKTYTTQNTARSLESHKKRDGLLDELKKLKESITSKMTANRTPGVKTQTSALVGSTGGIGSSVTPTLSVLV